MKKLLLLVFILSTYRLMGQTSDIVYVFDNSVIATYKPKKVGWYVGGFAQTSFPAPNIYTTPYVNLNRIGIDLTLMRDLSVMFGSKVRNGVLPFEYNPEVWIKLRLLNTMKKNDDLWDVTFIGNVSKDLYCGVGLCIPIR